jgi:hypothetical protein
MTRTLASAHSIDSLTQKIKQYADSTGEAIGSLDARVDIILERQGSMLQLLADQGDALHEIEKGRIEEHKRTRDYVAQLELDMRRSLRRLSRWVMLLSLVLSLFITFEFVRDARRVAAAEAVAVWHAEPAPASPLAARFWWAEGLTREPVVVVVGGEGGVSWCDADDDDPATTTLRCTIYAQGRWYLVRADDVTIAARGTFLPMVAKDRAP